MVDFRIPSGALVLVADGRRALFMKNVGTADVGTNGDCRRHGGRAKSAQS